MYIGLYESHITIKNQLTFPSRLRNETGPKLFISGWFENSLLILPLEDAETRLKKIIGEYSELLPEGRDLVRFMYGNAARVVLDNKNRFVLEKRLRDYSKIGKEAVFLGVNDRIELWDREIYLNYGKIRELQIRETAISLYNRITTKREDK